MLTINQLRSFLGRCGYSFFMDGTLKSYGVILMATVLELDTTHYLAGWAFTLQCGAGYLMSPVAGILLTKMSCRLVSMLGGLLAGSAYVIRGLVNISQIWQLFLLVSASGFGFGLVNISTVVPLKENFGTSYATVYAMTGLASNVGIALLPMLLKYLMNTYGDKPGMLIFGALSWTLIVIGATLPSSHEGKEVKDKQSDAIDDTERDPLDITEEDKHEDTNLGEGETMSDETETANHETANSEITRVRKQRYLKLEIDESTGRFPIKTIADRSQTSLIRLRGVFQHHPALIVYMVVTGIGDHGYKSWSIFLIPYGEYLGLKSENAVLLSTIAGLAGLLGRLYSILMFSRYAMDVYLGFVFPSLLIVVGYTITFFCDQFHVLAIVAGLTGFSYAVMSSASTGLIPSCVCDNHFTVSVVIFYTLWGLMIQIGGITTGAVVDITGSYRISFACLTVLAFLACVIGFGWTLSPLRLTMKKPGQIKTEAC